MVRDILQLNTFYKKALIMLGIAICAIGLLYGVLIKQTIAHVVERHRIENDMSELASTVSRLEATYMHTVEDITLAQAYDLGFEKVADKNTRFVARDTVNRAVAATVRESNAR